MKNDGCSFFISPMVQFLNERGALVSPPPPFASNRDTMLSMYSYMVLVRLFDVKNIALQRTGRMGTVASSEGQEAVGVGAAFAMKQEDMLFPSYRDHSAQIVRGVSLEEIMLFWGGDERGNNFQDLNVRHDAANAIPIATQTTHAAGAAFALKYEGKHRVAVCMLGDGATSRGDFYEAMNFAGVQRLPVVFVVTNNQFAISVPREKQTAAETLAQKAIAAGIAGVIVDGNDIIAVRYIMEKALARAREECMPTLVEAVTYRMCDHTTADDATRYRDKTEVELWRAKDPIARLEAALKRYPKECPWLNDAEVARIAEDCQRQVTQAAETYLATGTQPNETMFDTLYATVPAPLVTQRDLVCRRIEEGAV